MCKFFGILYCRDIYVCIPNDRVKGALCVATVCMVISSVQRQLKIVYFHMCTYYVVRAYVAVLPFVRAVHSSRLLQTCMRIHRRSLICFCW